MAAPPNWDKVRKFLNGFPDTHEATAHGRHGFKVGKKFLCAFNEEERALGVRIPIEEREMLMERDPDIYYITDHYRPYPAVLVSLDRVPIAELRHLLERRWRDLASSKVLKAHDAAKEPAATAAKPARKKSAAAPRKKSTSQ